ncbi:MAG: O-antigen ligase family protein [Legionellaceae bacterium]|nr:O-antigen ligase family protein [Legionellaceae bacterium]
MSITSKQSMQSTIDYALYLCVPLLFFVTPLSSSAKSILLGAIVAIILFTKKYRQELKPIFLNKYSLSIMLLFFIAALGCFWSDAPIANRTLVLEKWSKLLYLPFLIVGLKNSKTRNLSLNAFIFAMLITCILSIFMHITKIPILAKSFADGVFRNHIITGIMMSFATYLTSTLFLKAKNATRIYYLITSLLFSYQILFISQSRTCYAMYAILAGLFIIQNLNIRKAIIGALSVGIIFTACCYINTPLWSRIKQVKEEWSSFESNKNTSVGYRIQFHEYAKQLFHKHPLIGNGTGSFTHSFKVDNPVPSWTSDQKHSGKLLEPHSLYWLVAAEFGILGLIALAIFYSSLIIRFYNLGNLRPVAFALLAILAAGNLSDSLLFYSGPGYFFIMFFALFLSKTSFDPLVINSLKKSIENNPAKSRLSTNNI